MDHFPTPSVIDGLKATPKSSFLFSSRLQPFKRPETFLRAARICKERFGEKVSFIVCAYGWDKDYVQNLKEFGGDAVIWLQDVSQSEREWLLNNTNLVIPSNYESLNLLAYEQVSRGKKPILNSNCLAFQNNFWNDGNAIMFDGSPASLTHVVGEILAGEQDTECVSKKIPSARVEYPTDTQSTILDVRENKQKVRSITVLAYQNHGGSLNKIIDQIEPLLGMMENLDVVLMGPKSAPKPSQTLPNGIRVKFYQTSSSNISGQELASMLSEITTPTFLFEIMGDEKIDPSKFRTGLFFFLDDNAFATALERSPGQRVASSIESRFCISK